MGTMFPKLCHSGKVKYIFFTNVSLYNVINNDFDFVNNYKTTKNYLVDIFQISAHCALTPV